MVRIISESVFFHKHSTATTTNYFSLVFQTKQKKSFGKRRWLFQVGDSNSIWKMPTEKDDNSVAIQAHLTICQEKNCFVNYWKYVFKDLFASYLRLLVMTCTAAAATHNLPACLKHSYLKWDTDANALHSPSLLAALIWCSVWLKRQSTSGVRYPSHTRAMSCLKTAGSAIESGTTMYYVGFNQHAAHKSGRFKYSSKHLWKHQLQNYHT